VTWEDVLKIALGGFLAVLTQVVVQIWTDLRERRNLKREGSISALQVAIAMEEFAEDCADVASGPDPYANGPRKGSAAELLTPFGLPEEPLFPEDIDWKVFKPELADRVLSFGYLVRKRVESLDRFNRPSRKSWKERKEDAVELGTEAIRISDAIRIANNLSLRGSHDSWLPREKLEGYQRQIDRILDREAENKSCP